MRDIKSQFSDYSCGQGCARAAFGAYDDSDDKCRQLLNTNLDLLKILVCCGYFDLLTLIVDCRASFTRSKST